MRSRAHSLDQTFEGLDIHISLEQMLQTRLAAFRDDEIHCLRANKLDVGACSVEMSVVRNDVTFFTGHTKQDALRRATLMSRNHFFDSRHVLDGARESVRNSTTGVTFIAFHDGSPLMG